MYTFLRARKELLIVDHSYPKYICSDEKPCVVKETNHKIIYDLPTTDYDESKMTNLSLQALLVQKLKKRKKNRQG